jgi:hypothetical protein
MLTARHRTFVSRLLIALFGFAQAALPGAFAVVDATVGMSASPSFTVAHVEDGRQPGCQFVHGHECVVCATIAVLAVAPRQPAVAIVARATSHARPEHASDADAPLLLAARPRAPPLV